MKNPEDVIPHLGKPHHWKQGRSAKALADRWFRAAGIPAIVRQVLDTAEPLVSAELLEGWLERETDLRDGRVTPSQTDLLALIGLDDGLAVLGVEAKVDESFGPLVREWLASGGVGKSKRLHGLCGLLGLDPARTGDLRYQLLHRTAAVVLEARRFRTDRAILLVHSFCLRRTGLADCVAFFDAIGILGFREGALTAPTRLAGVDLRAGWVADTPPPAESMPNDRENV